MESAEGIQRVRPPKARLKALLQFLVDVPKAAGGGIRTIEVPEEEALKHLVMFDASVLLRASNALKAMRLLCEEAHWEFAAPILRQLFELAITWNTSIRSPTARLRSSATASTGSCRKSDTNT
jgi:hypothetical protein